MSNVIVRESDGKLIMTQPAVFTCGCSGVVPDTRNKLRMAGVADVPLVMTPTNQRIKQYLQQIGLVTLIPSLKKSKHSVLYNPVTGKYVDLLNAPKTDKVYENIFNVARGT